MAVMDEPHKPLPYLAARDYDVLHPLSVSMDGRNATITGGTLTRHLQLPEGVTIKPVSYFGNGEQMLCISHPQGKKLFYVSSITKEVPTPEGKTEIVHHWRDVKVPVDLTEDGHGHRLNDDTQLQEEIDSMTETANIIKDGWYVVEWCRLNP